jgi:hypothetical protein
MSDTDMFFLSAALSETIGANWTEDTKSKASLS